RHREAGQGGSDLQEHGDRAVREPPLLRPRRQSERPERRRPPQGTGVIRPGSGGIMDTKKLILGLSTLAVVAGLILVCFAPGGFLNRPQNQAVALDMPMLGEVKLETNGPGLGSPGPVTGFILLGAGAVGFVVAWAMKPSLGKPGPLS